MERAEFVDRYSPVIRAYLGARWRGTPLLQEMDDAVQDVFVDCFAENGALARVEQGRPGGFRAFLYGVVRNVALRIETRRNGRKETQAESGFEAAADDISPGEAFDRAWALSIVRLAAQRMAERAAGDERALRRVELLRLRFSEGRPMREISAAWGVGARQLEYEYERAREEFSAALHEVVRLHHSVADVAAECARLLTYLA